MSPLVEGKSKKAISSNISELQTGKMSAKRKKAIQTYADRNGLTFDEAKTRMSVKIAYSKAGKSKSPLKKKKKESLYI